MAGLRFRGGPEGHRDAAPRRAEAGRSDLDALVDATPATRDRVVDFLRAASICVNEIGDMPAVTAQQLQALTLTKRPGQTVPLTISRDDREQTVSVVLGSR